ncbi:MAG: phosphoribosylformylglycinamidine synthase subunit PurS [Candidatus Omnitrophica bacterium]|nr:phosphoribosylformylglycinamidine synthase subunit PurS [Candidatus Omnitrophota bacterium]
MKTFNAKINVTLKKSVLDPQGKTILEALHSLGFQDASDVRAGKHFELTLNANNEIDAQNRVKEMCDKLLVNPVIEQYEISIS